MPELLPRVNVREVDLDGRCPHRRQRVADGDAVVRQRRRIDDDPDRRRTMLLNGVDQSPLMVRLDMANIEWRLRGPCLAGQRLDDVIECRVTVDTWFPTPEEIEIRPVENENVVAWRLTAHG